MSVRQLYLGQTGKVVAGESGAERRLLGWMGDLVGCSQEELAQRAGLDSRSLRNFAAGKGGRGTIAKLAGAVPLPLWVVGETMLPTIEAVSLWSGGQQVERSCDTALRLAARTSVVEYLAKRGRVGFEPAGRWERPRHWAGLHPADARVLIGQLQSRGGWTRKALAARSGIGHETLRMYDSGEWPLEMWAVSRLAEGAELPVWLVRGLLLPAISAVRLVSKQTLQDSRGRATRAPLLLDGWEGILAEASERLIRARPETRPLIIVLEGGESHRPSAADRIASENLWKRLKRRSPAERVLLVKTCCDYHIWALVELLCHESREAASDSAKTAFSLALLALRVARQVRAEESFCRQLLGFAFVHLGNALRVKGSLRRAEEAFARGLELWQAGAGAQVQLLPEWRVLDLEASLRRSQRRFDEALRLLEMARAAAPQEFWGRILIKRATVLDQMLEPEASIAVLWEAAPLIDERREPRLALLWTSMLAVNFCHLDRYCEAKDLLPKAQRLAASLNRALDNLRLEWLRGRIEAGLGERDEALAVLLRVQGELRKLHIAYDYALVSLELGEILLRQHRLAEVKDLALEMEWIFKREGIHPEAGKAVDLFRRAVSAQRATPELARNVVRFLYKAQYNTELRFAA